MEDKAMGSYIGAFTFGMSGRKGQWMNPYNTPSCEDKLETFARTTLAYLGSIVAPTVFSSWIIKQYIDQKYLDCPIPFPRGKVYLQVGSWTGNINLLQQDFGIQ